MFEQYQILKTIAEGASATVYQAKQVLTERIVVIKVLQQSLKGDEVSLGRFQLEAKTTSALMHPNIVAVYSFGISKDDRPYLVMEYVHGRTLSDVLNEDGPLSMQRFQNLFLQVCEALEYAHSNGVLHRDLKPANIMLVSDQSGAETIKLLDFGIAKLFEKADASRLKLTQTGQLVGTPVYMSPEQCRGDKLDPRSDIYSLACVMYECLAGKPPFEGKDFQELALKHMNNEAPEFAKICPEMILPASLARLIFQCLSKEPGQRVQSASELQKQLNTCCREKAVRVQSVRNTGPIRFWSAIVLLIALVLLSGIGLQQILKRQVPAKEANEASSSDWQSIAMSVRSANREYDLKQYSSALRDFKEAIAQLQQFSANEQSQKIKISKLLYDSYRKSAKLENDYEQAKKNWQNCLLMARKSYGSKSTELAIAQLEFAQCLANANKNMQELNLAESLCQQSMSYYYAQIKKTQADDPLTGAFTDKQNRHYIGRYAMTLSLMGLILEEKGKPDEAVKKLEDSLSILDEEHEYEILWANSRLCRAFHKCGRISDEDKCVKNLIASLMQSERLPPDEKQDYLQYLIRFYSNCSDKPKNLQLVSRALKLVQQQASPPR